MKIDIRSFKENNNWSVEQFPHDVLSACTNLCDCFTLREICALNKLNGLDSLIEYLNDCLVHIRPTQEDESDVMAMNSLTKLLEMMNAMRAAEDKPPLSTRFQ